MAPLAFVNLEPYPKKNPFEVFSRACRTSTLITTDQAKALARLLLTEKKAYVWPFEKHTVGYAIREKLRSRTWPSWSTGSHPNADTLQSDLDIEASSIIWNPDLSTKEKQAVMLYLRTLTIAVSMSDTLFVKPLTFAAKDISIFTQPWESIIGIPRAIPELKGCGHGMLPESRDSFAVMRQRHSSAEDLVGFISRASGIRKCRPLCPRAVRQRA